MGAPTRAPLFFLSLTAGGTIYQERYTIELRARRLMSRERASEKLLLRRGRVYLTTLGFSAVLVEPRHKIKLLQQLM